MPAIALSLYHEVSAKAVNQQRLTELHGSYNYQLVEVSSHE